jgi:hypothetical protein
MMASLYQLASRFNGNLFLPPSRLMSASTILIQSSRFDAIGQR